MAQFYVHRNKGAMRESIPFVVIVQSSLFDRYRFIFAGAIVAIRNPGGHEITLSDDPDVCLDHLAFASLLLRRLERSGYK